jgi:uncharacterized protein YutE (UPF0331/DUF86 family)
MTVRPDVVLARLAHLGAVLAQIERLRALSPGQRGSDPLHQLAAERALHVAAEAVLDIGHHVLAGRGLPVPGTYREVIPAMAAAGILEAAVAARLDGMAGMWNILVHDYLDVDPVRVWEAIDRHAGDLHGVHAALAALPELALRRP